MEKVPFLRDIDDEKHYAQLLEVAYVEAYTELNNILARSMQGVFLETHPADRLADGAEQYEDLARLRFVMNATVQQSVDRRRRLAHVARRLADVVLDEEGAEE